MSEQSSVYIQAEKLAPQSRRIRLGIVGGAGGFIGPVHALAARMDNRYELVAGALSSKPEVARAAGIAWYLPEDRSYSNFHEMARKEADRADGIEVVAIATPNHLHYEAAKAFLEAGIHVICDKPLTTDLDEAIELVDLAGRSGLCFFVTHGFAAYPMVREARARVAARQLGTIRLVHVEFVMDWLTKPIDLAGDKHASWRTDPRTSGPGGAISDIGTHAYHLARFISGQEVTSLMASLHSMVAGRKLDDNAHLLLEFENGAKGTMIVTQVAPGNECGLRIRVYGDEAGLEWRQDDADRLRFCEQGRSVQIVGRGEAGLSADAQRMTRVPRGHPEGYLEAFANLYSEIGVALSSKISGISPPHPIACATVEDGALGIAFVEAALRSSKERSWVDFRLPLRRS